MRVSVSALFLGEKVKNKEFRDEVNANLLTYKKNLDKDSKLQLEKVNLHKFFLFIIFKICL